MTPEARLEAQVGSLHTRTGSQRQLNILISPDIIGSYTLTVRPRDPLLAMESESLGLVF